MTDKAEILRRAVNVIGALTTEVEALLAERDRLRLTADEVAAVERVLAYTSDLHISKATKQTLRNLLERNK